MADEKKSGKQELVHCFDCNQMCCRTTVIEVDPPRSIRDYSDLLFYLYHFDTEVVVAKNSGKKEWFVEFMSPCRFLTDGRCEIYEKRPLVCREYDMDGCEFNRPKAFTYIRTPDEFFQYLERKGPKRILKKLKKTHLPDGGYTEGAPADSIHATRTRIDRSRPSP